VEVADHTVSIEDEWVLLDALEDVTLLASFLIPIRVTHLSNIIQVESHLKLAS
jgi:hypothetical protein